MDIQQNLKKSVHKRAEELAKASKDLLLGEPFYGLLLIMLNKQWNNQAVPTAGVSRNGINYQLYLNEHFWDTLVENTRKGLLKHEILHIGFFHVTDFTHLTDHKIANIAHDLEINQFITKTDLPEGGQFIENYPELKLEPKKGTHYYYEKLLQGKKDGNCPNLNEMLAADAGCSVIIQVGGKDQNSQVPDHSSWEEFTELDEATQKMIRAQTEHILKEVADQVTKSRGTIPGEFSEILNKISTKEPPKFDWRRYLRNFIGGSTKTFTRKTRRKDSKRFAGSPGQKVITQKHILYCVDTSGSMSKKDLTESFQEIHHIYKQGAQVTVVQFDAAISHIEPYKRGYEDKIKIHGRGGTDFNAVVTYANENYRKFSAMVVLTDGCAPSPDDKCKLKTLWVHTCDSTINEDLPGPKIKLN